MSDLLSLSCQRYGKETLPFDENNSQQLLKEVDGWNLSDNFKLISKTFEFKNYYQTIAFVNATAWISNQQDHHPDLEVGYNRCHVIFSTHSIGGLSRNDFICAAKFDVLLASENIAN